MADRKVLAGIGGEKVVREKLLEVWAEPYRFSEGVRAGRRDDDEWKEGDEEVEGRGEGRLTLLEVGDLSVVRTMA